MTKVNGRFRGNSYLLKAREDEIHIEKWINGNGIIHYPSKRCSCGRKAHSKIRSSCTFYQYHQYGMPSYQIIELDTRLRMTDQSISHPTCKILNYDNLDNNICVQKLGA